METRCDMLRYSTGMMRDLSELPGALRILDLNESNCSYTMEAGETTLLTRDFLFFVTG